MEQTTTISINDKSLRYRVEENIGISEALQEYCRNKSFLKSKINIPGITSSLP